LTKKNLAGLTFLNKNKKVEKKSKKNEENRAITEKE
jgi:hypothetical protein